MQQKVDDLIEKYFEEGTLSPTILDEAQVKDQQITAQFLFYVVLQKRQWCYSITKFRCIQLSILDGQVEWTVAEEGDHNEIKIEEQGKASAYVFKTTIDQFSGKLSFIKVVTGKLTSDMEMSNPEVHKKEKLNKLYRAVGKKLVETSSLVAGDIGIIAKSNISATNCTLLEDLHTQDFRFKPLDFPQPIYSLAISTEDKKSSDKLNEALNKVAEEDLTFQIKFNKETKESVIMGMGDIHLQNTKRISDKQKLK